MKIAALLLFLGFTNIALSQTSCKTALDLAPEAALQTEKASVSTSLGKMQGYAKIALEHLTELERLTLSCECTEAYDKAYYARTNLDRALLKNDWDQARIYVVRALDNVNGVEKAMKDCAQGIPDASQFNSEKDMLKAQQKALLQKQQAIARQLEEYQNKTQELKKARSQELAQQREYRNNAEHALASYEQAVLKLNELLSCGSPIDVEVNYARNESTLQQETLELTKYYYIGKAQELHAKAQQILEQCRTLK